MVLLRKLAARFRLILEFLFLEAKHVFNIMGGDFVN